MVGQLADKADGVGQQNLRVSSRTSFLVVVSSVSKPVACVYVGAGKGIKQR